MPLPAAAAVGVQDTAAQARCDDADGELGAAATARTNGECDALQTWGSHNIGYGRVRVFDKPASEGRSANRRRRHL